MRPEPGQALLCRTGELHRRGPRDGRGEFGSLPSGPAYQPDLVPELGRERQRRTGEQRLVVGVCMHGSEPTRAIELGQERAQFHNVKRYRDAHPSSVPHRPISGMRVRRAQRQ